MLEGLCVYVAKEGINNNVPQAEFNFFFLILRQVSSSQSEDITKG